MRLPSERHNYIFYERLQFSVYIHEYVAETLIDKIVSSLPSLRSKYRSFGSSRFLFRPRILFVTMMGEDNSCTMRGSVCGSEFVSRFVYANYV